MRFLVDECTGPSVARWLVSQAHDVFSVFDSARGISDDEVLERAFAEDRILITNDRDFGEKIYRDRKAHKGILLLRLKDDRIANKIAVLQVFLSEYGQDFSGQFVVVTEEHVRFAKADPGKS